MALPKALIPPMPAVEENRWTLPLLPSFTAGYVDTAGFLALQGLFTAHVTGNFVTLGASLALGTSGAIEKLLALPVFCAVVIAGRLLSSNAIEAPARRLRSYARSQDRPAGHRSCARRMLWPARRGAYGSVSWSPRRVNAISFRGAPRLLRIVLKPPSRRLSGVYRTKRRRFPPPPLLADFVAKVFSECRTKIPRASVAVCARRREGPYRLIQNRSRTSVVALKSDAAAGRSKDQLREIFRVVRFSTFATKSALFGHAETS
jgi:hypothetical protein